MGNLHNVVWLEGMELDPHHFQQLDRFFRHAAEHRFRAVNRYAWGITDVEIDVDSLSNGKLYIQKLTAILPDGFVVDIPKTHTPPPMRDIKEKFDITDEQITAFLALPSEQENQQNCEIVESKKRVSSLRFVSETITVRDDNSGHDDRQLEIASPNFAVLFSNENREGYTILPIVEIKRDQDGSYIINDRFIPPCTSSTNSERLNMVVNNILESLVGKSSALWHSRKLPSAEEQTFTPNDAVNLGALRVLNHYIPLLKHAQSSHTHPEDVYKTLASLIGELYTYAGTSESLFDLLPAYEHHRLTHTFSSMEDTVRQLLERLGASKNYIQIPLQKIEDTLYHGDMIEELDFQLWNVYLCVASGLSDDETVQEVTKNVRISSINELAQLEQFALNGVEIKFLTRTPYGLPASKEKSYFQLNTSGFLWKNIIESKTIAMRIPRKLVNALFELVVIRREQ